MRVLLSLFVTALLLSCAEETTVKPSAKLRLEYPQGEYVKSTLEVPYTFLKNKTAQLTKSRNNGVVITYPSMNADVFLTYQQVSENNLTSLLKDAQKLAYGHNIKAQSIPEQPFVNPENQAYGMVYMINGDAASQAQFYITDSLRHFVTGALYFKAKPNFDSIYPAVQYLRNDMRTIMETMEWKE